MDFAVLLDISEELSEDRSEPLIPVLLNFFVKRNDSSFYSLSSFLTSSGKFTYNFYFCKLSNSSDSLKI